MSDDVVAKLEWLATLFTDGNQPHSYPYAHDVIQRARDEIVALRERCAQSDVDVLIETGRNEALEEAALMVEDYFNPETCGPCAAAIRALKEQ